MSYGTRQLNPDVNNLSQLSVVQMPAMSNRVGGVMPGANVNIDSNGIISVAAPGTGTVTSVALTMPAEFSVGGSPVTGAGTLAVTKANETANTVWAGPTSGGAAAPAFRALIAADVPVLTKVNGSALAVNIDNFSDTTPAAPTGFANIKFQSDASGNVSAYDPAGSWQNWSPSPSFAPFGADTMTVTLSALSDAQYLRMGPLLFYKLRFQLTFGGTLAQKFVVGNLPVASAGDLSAANGVGSVALGGYPYLAGGGYVQNVNQPGIVYCHQAMLTAATYNFFLSGFYRVI